MKTHRFTFLKKWFKRSKLPGFSIATYGRVVPVIFPSRNSIRMTSMPGWWSFNPVRWGNSSHISGSLKRHRIVIMCINISTHLYIYNIYIYRYTWVYRNVWISKIHYKRYHDLFCYGEGARHIKCVYMYTYNDCVMFMYYYLYMVLFYLVKAKVDVPWESLKHIELMFMWGGDVPTFASPGTTNQQLGSVKAASVLAP